MRSFAPFDLDAAILTFGEVNTNVVWRISAGTVCIEPCFKKFCDDKRFRCVPKSYVASGLS